MAACAGRTRVGKAAGTEGSCVAARGWGQGEGIGHNGRKETFMMVGRMSRFRCWLRDCLCLSKGMELYSQKGVSIFLPQILNFINIPGIEI